MTKKTIKSKGAYLDPESRLNVAGILSGNIPAMNRTPKPRPRNVGPELYPSTAAAQIIECVPDSIRPAVVLVAANLFRMEEAFSMTYEQLFRQWDEGWIWIPDSCAARLSHRYCSRWVPVSPMTRHLLAPYRNETGILFLAKNNIRASAARFRRTLKANGIPFVKNGLRRSCLAAYSCLGLPKAHTCFWAGIPEPFGRKFFAPSESARKYAYEWIAGLMGVGSATPTVGKAIQELLSTPRRPNNFLAREGNRAGGVDY